MNKKTCIAIFLFSLVVWYFYVKPQDYRVTFISNTFPGVINQSLKSWHKTIPFSESLEQESIYELKQQLKFNDSLHSYIWRIKPINDSVSKVIVDITDSKNSFLNRVSIIFGSNSIEKRSKKNVLDFASKLNEHIKEFKVHSFEEVDLFSTYYAYVKIKGTQFDKAKGMMNALPFLSNFIIQNGIQLNGNPFIEVVEWDIQTDSLFYNFCLPIIRSETLPLHPEIKYKRLFPKKAIKVQYNGNYITSDRAWYALLDYAKRKRIPVDRTPIEFFYNNPNMGGDDLNWRVEVFLPIKANSNK